MKFFTKVHNPKVHPLSKKMVDETEKMLLENGMDSMINRARCSLALFQATIRHVREIQSAFAKGHDTDKLLATQSKELKKILETYGVESQEKQEEIVLKYLEVAGSIGG